MTEKQIHVHFMGICGSGCASIALLASDLGYRVSGCDQNTDSYYAGELQKKGIQIYTGHDAAHLTDDVDIVAVSPALFDISPDNPELLLAAEKGILMTWQEFMGRCMQEGKRVIGISGTHGKTTTTFLTAELLIDGGKDPSVIGGSVYHKWGSGGRHGASDLFLCEADEFNRNFHNYHPDIAVLNNVEMDHPECYRNYEEVLASFCHFVEKGGKLRTLLLNADSEGCMEVLSQVASSPALLQAEVYAITRDPDKDFSQIGHKVNRVYYYTDRKDAQGTVFTMEMNGTSDTYSMRLYGEYNVQNAVIAVLLAKLLEVSEASIRETLREFNGVGRRFDSVGTFHGIPVFDDYAHHPTEISSVLSMCKEYFPDKKLLVVFEPHQVSRLRLMFQEYADALNIADRIIIMKTHIGREVHKNVHPITEEEWKAASDHLLYEENPEEIRNLIFEAEQQGECGMIVVVGAANSYKISRRLIEEP